MNTLELVLCLLSYISGEWELRLGGGTLHFLENLQRWSRSHRLYLVTTEDGSRLLRNFITKPQKQIVISKSSLARTRSNISNAIFLSLCVIKALFLRISEGFPADADTICTESHFLPDIVAAVVLRKRYPKAKLVTYLHHLAPSISQRRYHSLFPSILAYCAQQLSLYLMKRYGFYIFAFPYVKSQLVEEGFPVERIKHMTNGIDMKRIERMPPSKEKFDACFLGSIYPRKGVMDLTRIWRRVCDKVPEAKISVIGIGPKGNIERLKSGILAEKLENNMFPLGYVSEGKKFGTLKSSKIFLLPSYEEGWSIAICEAMSCGLPVVAYDLPTYKSVYKEGIVTVPIGDVESFAQSTIMLLENDEMMLKLSEEAKRQASEYELDKVAVAEFSLIKEICTGASLGNSSNRRRIF